MGLPATPIKSKYDRKAWDAQIKEQQKESVEKKDDFGMYKSIFKDSVPKSKILSKLAEGEHQFNIINYIVGKHHPILPEGALAYHFDYFMHKDVGPTHDNFICMARTYRGKCPICDYQGYLLSTDSYDKDISKKLYPQRRVIYNVVVLDTPKEQALGVRIFDVAQFSFAKPLDTQAEIPQAMGGGVIDYAASTAGKIILFKIVAGTYTDKKTGKTGKKVDYTGFNFLDRNGLTDEEIESAFQLDELIYIPKYAEVYEAFHQKKYVDEEAEEPAYEVRRQEDDVVDPDPLEDKTEFTGEEVKEEPKEEVKFTECKWPEIPFGESFGSYEDCDSCERAVDCKEKFDELEEEKRAAEEAAKAPTPKPKPKAPETKPEPRRRPGR